MSDGPHAPAIGDQARYYAAPSATSDLSRHAAVLRLFPGTQQEAGRWARNAVLHVQDAVRLGLPLDAARLDDLSTRSAARMVDRLLLRNAAPLSVAREPHERIIGNCHHTALLACAFLRHAGVPARLRYGFAPYLKHGTYEDHCICEVLQGSRWRPFDPRYALDVGDEHPETFLGGGGAWRLCRSGDADPEVFGSDDLLGADEQRGWWFIRNNVVRDFAALCKVELHPWDWWGLMTAQEEERPAHLIDELAGLTLDENAWAVRAERFETDALVNPNGKVVAFSELGDVSEFLLPSAW